MYIHVRLPAKPVHSLNNLNIEDSVWCLVTMNNTDKVLVGVVYRAPSSPLDNDCRMLTALNDLQCYQPHSHCQISIGLTTLSLVGTAHLPHNFLMLLKMHC